jgi:hypothetical protein
MFLLFIRRYHLPDNVVLYRDFPKDSSPKEPYVLHEGEVRGCVADEFDSHEGLALLLSS